MKRTMITLMLAGIFLLCGCQPTPEEPIVVNKAEGLEEHIRIEETEEPKQEDNAQEWTFEKEYDNERKLNVKAQVKDNSAGGVPVVSLAENKFQGNTPLIKKIVGYFCDESYELLEGVYVRTKQDVMEEIIERKQSLQKAKQEGDPPDVIAIFEYTIEVLENEMKNAPDKEVRTETDYKLKEADGSNCLDITAIKDDNQIEITFWDDTRRKGSGLLLQDRSSEYPMNAGMKEFHTAEVFRDDEVFQKGKATVDAFLAEMGLDYLQLNVAADIDGEGLYEYCYTREVNGIQETYVNNYFGMTQTDDDVVMNLWETEQMTLRTDDGKIVYVLWDNPSLIASTDNNNVKIIPFDEAKEIFLKQMDYIISPNIDDGMYEFLQANKAINITRIELGLTKLLMKDSGDSYKLIPTWNFYGYEAGSGHEINLKRSADTCYVTINALDGSIVNHKVMN